MKHEKKAKRDYLRIISFIFSTASILISSIVGVWGLTLAIEDRKLENFAPSIEPSFSFSTVTCSTYMRNESFAYFWGNMNIDLMVLASQYSKLTVSLKILNYSQTDYEWIDLERQNSYSFSNQIVYESFIERGFNPINATFPITPSIAVKPNFISLDTKGFGFQLSNVTVEAKLVDLVTRQTVITQEFNEGIFIMIREIG